MSTEQFDYVLGLVGPHISRLPSYHCVRSFVCAGTYDVVLGVVRRCTQCERRLRHYPALQTLHARRTRTLNNLYDGIYTVRYTNLCLVENCVSCTIARTRTHERTNKHDRSQYLLSESELVNTCSANQWFVASRRRVDRQSDTKNR